MTATWQTPSVEAAATTGSNRCNAAGHVSAPEDSKESNAAPPRFRKQLTVDDCLSCALTSLSFEGAWDLLAARAMSSRVCCGL